MQAHADGLTYSMECAEDIFFTVAELSHDPMTQFCSTDPSDYDFLPCANECQIYSGAAELDESCQRYGRFMSTCAPGLVCGFDNRCYTPCDRPLEVPLGGACGYEIGLLHEACAPNLTCDAVSHICVESLVDGLPCTVDSSLCSAQSWCDPTTLRCTPRLALDQPCRAQAQCESLVCNQVCRPRDAWGCAHPWL